MSLFEVMDDLTREEDHFPLLNRIDAVETRHGGYEKWAAGCICGWYDKGTPGRSFIPSKHAAERLYKEHLIRSGVRPANEVGFDPDDTEEAEMQYHQAPDKQTPPGFGHDIPPAVRTALRMLTQ